MLLTTPLSFFFFFFNDTATTEIYTLSLHDALPISDLTECHVAVQHGSYCRDCKKGIKYRSEEHTSELQSRQYLVCRLLLEKKKATGTEGPRRRPESPYSPGCSTERCCFRSDSPRTA